MSYLSESFRAPPPSPVASGRRSFVANDEFLTEFLHNSLRVPDLVLPEHVSPRQKSKTSNLPKLDYKSLDLLHDHKISDTLDAVAKTGCFELVNHGINDLLIRFVAEFGGKIFELSNEEKQAVLRSSDRMYGFVESNDDEKETSEEFVWCRDDELRAKMEAIMPLQYSNFSDSLDILSSKIESICGMILEFLLKNTSSRKSGLDYDEGNVNQIAGSVCYLYRHHKDLNTNPKDSEHTSSLRYDMIRMLIRGSEHSHTLCLHVCDGLSEFHVYSKKGRVSFCPEKDALVITIGDQLQKWSDGKYKHVMGRPISKDGEKDHISMAFMYNQPSTLIQMKEIKKPLLDCKAPFSFLVI
ncbi:1-aminocyclopropane-1-carboxylate oxidase 5-like protein [Tanacetum coccineum]|uniref:1-aminocyclopropane-1-carboxylate oxidase 5-like protein n=1 Tax=Tanacetum coccineum TaxID=301880 RepID=A0ABQ4ZCS8_9ASTR